MLGSAQLSSYVAVLGCMAGTYRDTTELHARNMCMTAGSLRRYVLPLYKHQ